MSLPLNEKMKRVLSFLMGVRNPRIMAVMTTRGFTQQDLDEGWQLFTVAAGAKLAYTPDETKGHNLAKSQQYLADLDQWENTWFPLVSATLERHYPELYHPIFKNLSQTEGPEVLVSVSTLLDRLQSLAQTETGKQALALLAHRGLTPEVRTQATKLIEALQKFESTCVPQINPDSRAIQDKAINDVWIWYKEWSQIARTVIQRGDLLIRLGLRQPNRSSTVEEVEDHVEGPTVAPSTASAK